MLEEENVWTIKCADCGKIMEAWSVREQAEKEWKNRIRYNLCVICEKPLCVKCRIMLAYGDMSAIICKECIGKISLEDFVEAYRKKLGDC